MFLLVLALLPLVSAQVTVTTSRGTVTGFHEDLGSDTTKLFYGAADVFLGIPFAKPPIGELRWKLPQRICDYGTGINATAYRDQCPESNVYARDPRYPPFHPSDDCLYLNVITPRISGKFPVMVWIHGGALQSGAADLFDYRGGIRNLVSHDVVVVTIQYRLAMTGFFTTYTEDFPPNRGIYDQLMALRWVQEEIANFGGDPARVTIFGESAGGVSVSTHTLSPLSRGLFHRTIQQSGTILLEYTVPNDPNGDLSQTRAQQYCNFGSDQWQAGDFTALKACLNGMNSNNFPNVDNAVSWKVSLDGAVLPRRPRDLAKERPLLPAIIGEVTDEIAVFLPFLDKMNSTYTALFMDAIFPSIGDKIPMVANMAIQTFRSSQGIPAEDDLAGWYKINDEIFTNMQFSGMARREVEWHLDRGHREVYVYDFNRVNGLCLSMTIDGLPVAYHSSDNCYLWMLYPIWTNTQTPPNITQDDIALANFMGTAWTNFAKGLVPDPAWRPVSDRMTLEYLQFDTVPGRMLQRWRAEGNVLFNEVLPVLLGEFPIESVDATTEQKLAVLGQSVSSEFEAYLCHNADPPGQGSSSTASSQTSTSSYTSTTTDPTTTSNGVVVNKWNAIATAGLLFLFSFIIL